MSNYVQLGPVRTWYAETGDGEPVLLLHGGFVDSRTFDDVGSFLTTDANPTYQPIRRA